MPFVFHPSFIRKIGYTFVRLTLYSCLLVTYFFFSAAPCLAQENPSMEQNSFSSHDNYYHQAKRQLQMGNYQIAHQLILRAIENDKQRYGTKHEKIARNLNLLATIIFNRGQFRSARTYFLQSQNIRKQLFNETDIILTENLFGLANIDKVQGLYRNALINHQAILAQKLKSPLKPNLIESYLVVAKLHQELAQYDQTETALNKVSHLIQQQSHQHQMLYARLLIQKGALATARGLYSDAKDYEKRALELLLKIYGRRNVLVADTLSNMANRFSLMNKNNLAIPLYQEAAIIYRSQLGASSLPLATCLNSLAKTLLKNGEDEKAINKNNQAYKMANALIRKKHPFFALNQINRANYLNNRKEFTVAQQLYRGGLKTLESTYGKSHPLIVKLRLDMETLPSPVKNRELKKD